jgi:hypothetical protein
MGFSSSDRHEGGLEGGGEGRGGAKGLEGALPRGGKVFTWGGS